MSDPIDVRDPDTLEYLEYAFYLMGLEQFAKDKEAKKEVPYKEGLAQVIATRIALDINH